MSGGHWDYAGGKVRMHLERVTDDIEVERRWPKTRLALAALAEALYRIERDMDLDLSGDFAVEHDRSFDTHCLALLRDALDGCTCSGRIADRHTEECMCNCLGPPLIEK